MRIKQILIFSGFVVALLIFDSCSQDSNKTYENTDQMVEAALSDINSISKEELKLLFDEEVILQLVDCREESDFKKGHILGAINIPRGVLEFSPKLSNRRLKTIVLGNNTGSGALAVKTLREMKYANCYLLDCTMEEWARLFPQLTEKGASKEDVPLKKVKAPEGC